MEKGAKVGLKRTQSDDVEQGYKKRQPMSQIQLMQPHHPVPGSKVDPQAACTGPVPPHPAHKARVMAAHDTHTTYGTCSGTHSAYSYFTVRYFIKFILMKLKILILLAHSYPKPLRQSVACPNL